MSKALERERNEMNLNLIMIQFSAGLSFGMLVFILAIGLSLVLGVAKILNFAHGTFYMLSAFLSYTIVQFLGSTPNMFWIALIVAPIVIGLFGGLCEITLFRPIYREELTYQLLLTYALVFILSDIQKMIWGTENFVVWIPDLLSGGVNIFGQYLGTYNLFLIFLGPVLCIMLWLLLNKTKMGNLIRAAALDREMLSALGVDTKRLYTLTFMIGIALAGLAGVLGAGLGTVNPGMDMDIILPCFIVVVIGGMGSLWGTLLGAFLLGQVNAFGLLFLPRLALAFSFILMAIVLIIRPWGLLGEKGRGLHT
jgi:branched-subunit amino acid ABC-type transport system permease component